MNHNQIIFLFFIGFGFNLNIDRTVAENLLMNIKEKANYVETCTCCSEYNSDQNTICNPTITIIDENESMTKIKCDTLIKNEREPTLLKGNVVALFYNENDSIASVLKADMAEYKDNISLIARKNITISNKIDNKELSFIKPSESVITWYEKYGTISSDKEFIILSDDGCTAGSSFESNVDLSEIRIVNSKGNNLNSACKNIK